MKRKLVVQIVEGGSYYGGNAGDSVTLQYCKSDGSVDTSIGDAGKAGDFAYVGSGVWSVEVDSDNLDPARTDWYKVIFGPDSTELLGYEFFYFPTIAFSPALSEALIRFAEGYAEEPRTPAAPTIIQRDHGVVIENVGALKNGELFKVYYEVDEEPDINSRYLLLDTPSGILQLSPDVNGRELRIKSCVVNRFGVAGRLSAESTKRLDLGNTVDAIVEALAINDGFITRVASNRGLVRDVSDNVSLSCPTA